MKYRSFKALLISSLILIFPVYQAIAQKVKSFALASPDAKINIKVKVGQNITWSVNHGSTVLISPSEINVRLQTAEVLGHNASVVSAKTEASNSVITTTFYKKNKVENQYKQLTLKLKGGYGLVFRAYNDGVAYRFFTSRKDSLTITSELSAFNFPGDQQAFIPYVLSSKNDPYEHSYENMYRNIPISAMAKDSLAYLPLMISYQGGIKAVITEANLEDYPGMYLKNNGTNLLSDFSTFPLLTRHGGYNMTQEKVTKRGDFIAKTSGTRFFPWRLMAVSTADHQLLNNDLVFKLADSSRIANTSWIKPGKVAWDWWNDWNISGVDFKAGINTETYKHYIDFAAEKHIEYVLLDEGWAEKGDIMKIVPEINLQEIIAYGNKKNVGIWLWAGMYPINEKMDEAFEAYAKMGVKGFKIDFINRDDQPMMQFYYRAAKKAAAHQLMIDFHGSCKPTGLMRTYPNVLNYEGVYGLEMVKFPTKMNFPELAVTIPFIRMLAGALDYTPGAMRNAVQKDFFPSYSTPMSQGTRCQQLAMYVVFEAPFEMLADNPTSYRREAECTDFITAIPTTFDETIALDGSVGNYAALARRKGNSWYAGALNNWTARDMTIDLSFLGEGNFEAEIFKEGKCRPCSNRLQKRNTAGYPKSKN
ncbi:glycoside hydrolase family 97 protein [Pedobacter sp. MC2016-14]|nr:glycoside hydrolase family 97 protein [Pedobacter sp. MC2016-14]MCD0487474.1 glycoside hydrolase family 97 protein [Pedobacter sp. MC2016-14]